jgi:hypothetical protein
LEWYVQDKIQPALERFTLRKIYSGGSDDLKAARDALDAAEHELSTFATDPHARARMGDALWQQALDARADAVERAQTTYREQVKVAGIDTDGKLDVPGTALFWLAEPEQRRVFYEMMIECCSVRRGRGPLSERVKLDLRVLPDGSVLESAGPPDALLTITRGLERMAEIDARLAELEQAEQDSGARKPLAHLRSDSTT